MDSNRAQLSPVGSLASASDAAVPAYLTSFVGRGRELDQIGRLLNQARLVTVTGVGGVGKTRLAVRAAGALTGRFPDGVRMVDLTALRDPALIPHTVVDTLRIPQRSARDPMSTLIEYLRYRRMLLVVDNCEHLLDHVAAFLDRLLRAVEGVRVLATSRQRLGVAGERLLPLPPLPVPGAEATLTARSTGHYPALTLFADRAGAVVPDFAITADNLEAVTRLCQRLEGIPLALELAAVRLRVLEVRDLADRLDDRFGVLTDGGRTAPARHRTLRATIDWSYELCTPAEQLLWSRASIFAGSFDLAAAEAVCVDDALPARAVLDTLAGLVDKSIVIREESAGHARFRLLEMIREYGHVQLQQAGAEVALRERHRDWYVRLIDQACAQWFGPTQENWCTRLRVEQPNLRTAFDFCLAEPGEIEAGLHLAGRPWFLWVCLFLAEGRHWLDRALAADAGDSAERSRALATAGYVAALQGDRLAAHGILADAALPDSAPSDPAAYPMHVRGVFTLFFGTAEDCQRLLQTALDRYAGAGAPEDLVVVARIQLGLSRVFAGDVAGAHDLFEQCRARCELMGEQWLRSYALYGLALADLSRGKLETATDHVRASLAIKRVFNDTLGLAMALDLSAWIRAACGAGESAATLLGAAARLWRTFGVELFGSVHWLEYRHECEAAARRAAGDAAFDAAFTAGSAMGLDATLRFAMDELGPSPGASAPDPELTRREIEVAELVGEGLSNKEIATALHISLRTAETHVQHILSKLGYQSRTQIARWVSGRRTGVGPSGPWRPR